MPRAFNPLFHAKTIEKWMLSFGFPEDLNSRLHKIANWLAYIQAGNKTNPATDAEFLHDLCVDVLGYQSPFAPDAKKWELEFTPTATLGFFDGENNSIVAEIIVGDINNKPQVNYETTQWIIVTNYRYIRLYDNIQNTNFKILFQEFKIELILTNSEYLKCFYFLLCRRSLLAANFKEQSRLSKLLIESEAITYEIANNFYGQYQKIQKQLIKDFTYRLQLLKLDQECLKINSEINSEINPGSIELIAINKAQKLLNRIIFITFFQSQKLLPIQLIIDAFQFDNPYKYQAIWENYKAIFAWINNGNSANLVFNYGGSLFEFDFVLDELLFVGDELCRQIKELSRFDFNLDISNITIAFILEQLNKDLVALKSQSVAKQKKLKPYKIWQTYQSIETIIKSHLERIKNQNQIKNRIKNENIDQENSIQLIDRSLYKTSLENLVIYAPECGSGMVLVMALNILVEEYRQVYENLDLEYSQNLVINILQNQIFGNAKQIESVEITKLNLWLNTAFLHQELIDLSANIYLDISDFPDAINRAQAAENLVILR